MIVVKEEQGAGEWVRNGGSESDTTGYGRATMLKEDLPPNLPPDHHTMSHNNSGHNHSNNNNNNSPTLANHNHHGSGITSCANPGQGHPHGPNNNNTNCNTSGSGNNICSGCGQRILDRYYVLAVDRQWHNECLKCHSCGIVLSNQLTCFSRDGLILCKEDYYRYYY
ncbi:LIM/homeobox protein Lhx2 [Orchesella cincta]|uniref:LIM/homeobox protein Lhx2 n=1 Tax=Orchesella cincta TaxID=48709 RepID=A0A1D2NFZ3_ORCCI|nr:LIM/homeobox protein Lhx2 [Orchesella cincta]